jgi:hypothetical protein
MMIWDLKLMLIKLIGLVSVIILLVKKFTTRMASSVC